MPYTANSLQDRTGWGCQLPKYIEPDATATAAPASPAAVESAPPALAGVPPGPLVPSGLRGVERWRYVEKSSPGILSPLDYREWLKSLPDDPGDPEYQAELDGARKRALVFNPNVAYDDFSGVSKMRKRGEGVGKMRQREGTGPDWSDADSPEGAPPPPPPPPVPGVATLSRFQSEEESREAREAKAVSTRATFEGRPIGSDELYGPIGIRDPHLDAYLAENGIALSTTDKSLALRSGKYVYMGTEHNDQYNTDHDVYVYVEDAQAAGVNPNVVPADLISSYQTQLGLPITGKLDQYLTQEWDRAVAMAQRYAQTGVKMSVIDLFKINVSSAIARKNSSGSGGGGAAPMEEFDYYRAMMQILGDISGVEG